MFGLFTASIIMLIPLIGTIFIALTDKKNVLGIKSVSFWTSLFALCFSVFIAILFDYSTEKFTEEVCLFSNSIVKYRVGLDVLSVLFVPIICLICFLCILWITKRKSQKKKTYFMSILLFETFSIGAFYAWDIFLLFMMIESTIIPIYIIMSQRREQSNDAIFHFLIYTMSSAILILIAFILIYLETHTSNIIEIYKIGVKNKAVFWLLILGIGIKMPIWPFYNWLPIAHVKSQTICSVLLAAIVLKFSTLLILRFIDPLFMNIFLENKQWVLFFISLSMLFSTSQLIFQDDLKRVFAYFSIIHLNMAFLILLSGMGKGYFIFTVMHHSLLTSVLFFSANIVKRLYGTRLISELKNISTQLKEVRRVILFSFLCLISVPFSWGFISEILTIQAISKISTTYTIITSGIILISSLYAMHVYNSCFGYWRNGDIFEINDFYVTDIYKKLALFILFGIIIIIGLFPKIILGCF